MQIQENGIYTRVYGQTLWASKDPVTEALYSRNPACPDDLLGVFPLTGPGELVSAVQAAEVAAADWHHAPAENRRAIFTKLLQGLQSQQTKLTALLSRESGLRLAESQAELDSLLNGLEHLLATTLAQPAPEQTVLYAASQQLFPGALPDVKLLSALLAGQALIWAPAPEAPVVAYFFAQLLQAAGLPPGVLQLVFGPATSPTALETNHQLQLLAPAQPSPKQALLVLEDANLEQAVAAACWLGYHHGGQSSSNTGSVILHPKLATAFKQRLLEKAQQLQTGDPLLNTKIDYGPLCSENQLQQFMQHYDWGQSEGASLLYGKGRIGRDNLPAQFVGEPNKGLFVWPVIWEQVRADMQLAQCSVWGPMLALIEAHSTADALTLVNALPCQQVMAYTQTNEEALQAQLKARCQVNPAIGFRPYLRPSKPTGLQTGLDRQLQSLLPAG